MGEVMKRSMVIKLNKQIPFPLFCLERKFSLCVDGWSASIQTCWTLTSLHDVKMGNLSSFLGQWSLVFWKRYYDRDSINFVSSSTILFMKPSSSPFFFLNYFRFLCVPLFVSLWVDFGSWWFWFARCYNKESSENHPLILAGVSNLWLTWIFFPVGSLYLQSMWHYMNAA